MKLVVSKRGSCMMVRRWNRERRSDPIALSLDEISLDDWRWWISLGEGLTCGVWRAYVVQVGLWVARPGLHGIVHEVPGSG